MKNIFLLIIILFLIFSCKNENNKINIDNYISLEYGSFDNNGAIIHYVSPVITENSDSIGKTINKHSRRIKYLLTNRINNDTLNALIPDSTNINKVFKSEIFKKKFVDNFKKIVLPNKQPKELFSENEMMIIASKFFLAEKLPNNSFGTRVCIGINGNIDKNNIKKDYTLLEAVIFDAIFEEILQNDNAKFMRNLKKYQNQAVEKSDSINKKKQILQIRNSIYKSMKNDDDLKKYLMEYFKKNLNNIPLKIKSK